MSCLQLREKEGSNVGHRAENKRNVADPQVKPDAAVTEQKPHKETNDSIWSSNQITDQSLGAVSKEACATRYESHS